MPDKIQNLITERNYHRRQWVRYRFIGDFQQSKVLTSQINSEIELFRNNNWNVLLESLDKRAPPFWNLTKILRQKAKQIPVLTLNSTRFSTPLEKCEVLAQTFKENHSYSLNLSDSATELEITNCIRDFNHNCLLTDNIRTNTDDIISIIKTLKNKKAPGKDGINNKCLKSLPRKGII